MSLSLEPRQAAGGSVLETSAGLWRLHIPAGPGGTYRWAQLDDYMGLARRRFPHHPPVQITLRARVSAAGLPGTWGFGLWNDPFSASFGVSGMVRRLPALPNAAWFFYAGPPNYLALRDTHPAQGLLAATFAAPNLPFWLMAPGGLAAPLLLLPPAARLLRRLARLLIREDAALVPGDPTAWRSYRLDCQPGRVTGWVDGEQVFTTPIAPRGPLGLVLWIDNQYAAFPPSGRLQMGTSENPEAWLELADVEIKT
jgi:hypothetical protein